jgi:hypothetical protein
MYHGGWNEQTISRWYPLDQVENGNDGTFGGTHHFAFLSCVQESVGSVFPGSGGKMFSGGLERLRL